jgi:quinol monooxygenase YgiN
LPRRSATGKFDCEIRRTNAMLIVHVHVHVKPDSVEAFRKATVENASQSMKEPGVARFDVCQQQDDPNRFVLVEAYRTTDAPAQHKETAHYQKWRDAVQSMMAEPRTSVKYTNVSELE